MPDDDSWRSPESTAYLDRVQRVGFAWEFLRRNPDYQEDYERMSRLLASGTAVALEVALALAQRWSLSFPVRPTAAERSGTHTMGIQRPSDGDCADGRAAKNGKHRQLRSIDDSGPHTGTNGRSTHPVAGPTGTGTDLDSSRRASNRSDRRRYPVRHASAATCRSRPSPVAAPCWRGAPNTDLDADHATTPPHDPDAEST